jgi:hypothetical protein
MRALLALSLFILFGCDPNREKQCEWFLMPEPELKGTTSEGKIPVCARNLVNNKQYCKLQTDLEYAEKNYGKRFRFVDLKTDPNSRYPKTVESITFCDTGTTTTL